MLLEPLALLQEPTDSATGPDRQLDRLDFLRLLIVQMQNQDPLEPLKNEEFVAQLAQFSSLEQLINMNESLSALNLLQSSINNSQALNLIGKRITVSGNALQINDGEASRLSFVFTEDADSATLKVLNGDGETVRTIELGSRDVGRHEYDFDALDDSGEPLPDGDYTFQITGVNSEIVALRSR